jgi:hypothetical protein
MMHKGGDMSYCEECQIETRWLTVRQAAGIVQRGERTVYNWIEKRLVHVRILPIGRGKRICENSLLLKLKEEDE